VITIIAAPAIINKGIFFSDRGLLITQAGCSENSLFALSATLCRNGSAHLDLPRSSVHSMCKCNEAAAVQFFLFLYLIFAHMQSTSVTVSSSSSTAKVVAALVAEASYYCETVVGCVSFIAEMLDTRVPETHLILQKTKAGTIKVDSYGICLQIVKEIYNMNKQLFFASFFV
jgi:hypothetical protein